MSTDTTHRIVLEVPVDPLGVRLARLVAAGLGDEAGLDLERIDDLRIGIDELLFLVVEHDDPPGGPFRLDVSIGPEELIVAGDVATPDEWVAPAVEPGSIQAAVLAGVSSDYEVDAAPGRFSFRLRTRLDGA